MTVLFCDVTGSTALGERFDPETVRAVLDRYFREMRRVIEHHGGSVERFIGDAVMAVFGMPRVHEDDALRAVRVAAEIRERLPEVASEAGVELRFRTGVNTGPLFIDEGGELTGDAVNVAARLEQAAQPGEILLGPGTYGLVRDAVVVRPLAPLSLKGKSERVPAFALESVDPVALGVARRLDLPLVGRERELRLLRAVWARTVRLSSCQVVTVVGMAGVGKSRLLAEVMGEIGPGATVLRGRCLHYGEGITFWPLVEAMRSAGDAAREVLERLGSGGVAAPEELFLEFRRLLESLAAERPLILHIDDLQWAEPMLLDLLDHVVDLSRGLPILLLCAARGELLDERPNWSEGKRNATLVRVGPLDITECEALLDHLSNGLDEAGRARVVAASEGNPLFLEEMAALARERGTVEVPSTIQALLAARLERLELEDREVLERGAVEGEVFHRLAVRALAHERLVRDIDARLIGLVRKELIRPHPATLPSDQAFRFRHLLIRDAAYGSLPKATRAELHERFADWMEDNATELAELNEIAGWHLEQAVDYRQELQRPSDAALARRAAEHLHRAARRAHERSDSVATRNLLGRALRLSPTGGPLQARIAVDLAEQEIEFSDFERADQLLALAERDREVGALARLARIEWLYHARPEEAQSAAESLIPEMLEHFAREGDERGLAKAHLVAVNLHVAAGRTARGAEHALLAAAHAKNGGDEGVRVHALRRYISILSYGPTHATKFAAELDEIEREQPGPYLAALVELERGEVKRLEGKFDDARKLTERALESYRALGIRWLEGSCHEHFAFIALSENKPQEALESFLKRDAIGAELGDVGFRSTMQAQLADAYARVGQRDAAYAAIDLCERLSAAEDVPNFAMTHAVRARLALADGDADAAERWARSSIEFADQIDLPDIKYDARCGLAHVLAARGRPKEAIAAAMEALETSETKGDCPRSAAARQLLDALTATVTP